MTETHLSLEDMARFLAGSMEHEEVRTRVAPHLFAVCPVCRQRHAEIRRLQAEIGHWSEEVAVFEGPQALELWERLAGLGQDERLKLAEESEELHTWGLCQFLIGKSREVVFDAPERAVDLAGLAARLSTHLGEAYDRDWIYDLRARAFAHLGNARRVLGETRSAEDAFRKAWRCLDRSMSGNRAARAELLWLLASLRRAQRRFEDALRLLEEALALFRAANDTHGVGAALLNKAKILSESGEEEEALKTLEESATEIDPAAEPRLFAYLRFNLVVSLIRVERYKAAQRLMPEVRALMEAMGQPLDLLRVRWADGNVALGLGRRGPAEAAFREVQQDFLDRGMGYDAALVSLDLAQVYAQENRLDDLKRLAAELMPVFASREVHREALVALLLFQKACEEEHMTVTLAREIAAHLRRERISPV